MLKRAPHGRTCEESDSQLKIGKSLTNRRFASVELAGRLANWVANWLARWL